MRAPSSTPTLRRVFPVGPCVIRVTALFLFDRWPGFDIEWDPGPRMWPLPLDEQRAFQRGLAEAIASILFEMNWMPDYAP